MSVKIRPVGRRYLLEMESIEDRKISKIYVPNTSSETTRVCRITQVGTAEYDAPQGCMVDPRFKVGDRVLISSHAGYNLDMKTYGILGDIKIVNEGEIMASIGDE
jgi:co-chaperonin GroES (HSP10)